MRRRVKIFHIFCVVCLLFSAATPTISRAANQPNTGAFPYGVLAVNTDRAAYEPGQNVLAQMGSLDNTGHTLCNSNLELDVLGPDGQSEKFVTDFGTASTPKIVASGAIVRSITCGNDNVTNSPDYVANFSAPSAPGQYTLTLRNLETNVVATNIFTVQENLPFVVQRQTATRINPFKSVYRVNVTVTAKEDFYGRVEEFAQQNFVLSDFGNATKDSVQDQSGENFWRLAWPVTIKAGESVHLSYVYQAPLSSPDFFRIGFLQLRSKTFQQIIQNLPADDSGKVVYAEQRAWEIASDASITAVKTGNWSSASTWSTGAVPTASDNVTIASSTSAGITVTVDVNNAAANMLYIASSTNTGTLAFNSGSQLTVSATTTLGNSTNAGTLTMTSGGTLITKNLAGVSGKCTFTQGTGSIQMTGSQTLPTVCFLVFNDLTINGNGITVTTGVAATTTTLNVAQGTFAAAAFALYVSGTSTATGTLSVTSSTGAKTFGGPIIINNGGTFNNSGNAAITVQNGITNNGTFTSGSGTYTFNTNNQSLAGSNSLSFAGAVTVTSITLTNNASTSVTGAVTGTGGWTQAANSNLSVGATAVALYLTTMNFTASGNTVNYNRTNTQTIATTTFYNLTISGSGAKTIPAGTTTVSSLVEVMGTATITATGALSYGSSATLQYDVSSVTTSGEWPATFTASGGVIINSGTVSLAAAKQIGDSTHAVDLTINSGGTLSQSSRLITLYNNFINNGAITSGSGGMTIIGTNNQSIGSFTTTGTVTMSKTGGTATTTGNISGAGLTINGSGGTLDLGSSLTHTFTGTLTLTAGTLKVDTSTLSVGSSSGSAATFSATSGTVIYSGASPTVAPVAYNNLSLTGSGKAVTTNVSTINGNFTVSGSVSATTSIATTISGNLTVGTTGALEMGNVNFTVIGNASVTTGSLFLAKGTATTTFSGGLVVNGTLSGAGTGAMYATGGVTGSGTVNLTGNTFETNGTGFFGSSGNAWTFKNLNIGNSTSAVITSLAIATTTVTGALAIGSTSSFNAGPSIFVLSGTGSPFVTNGGTFTASTSMFSFQGTSGTITVPAATYYNLDFSPASGTPTYRFGSGTMTINGNLTSNGAGNETIDVNTNDPVVTIAGNLAIGSGDTFSASQTATTSIAGNMSINGTFTANSGTVVFNPAATSTITSAASTTFYNIYIAAPSDALAFGHYAGNNLFTIAGTMAVIGTSGNIISIVSDSPGSQWLAHFSSAQSAIKYVYIKDSGCDGTSATANVSDGTSINGGNNGACWVFVAGYSVSGVAYTDDTGATGLSGQIITVLVNGSYSASSTTDGSGNWAASNINANSGDIITAYIAGYTTNGMVVERASGSTLSGLNIYGGTVALMSADSASVTTANLATANTGVGGSDQMYTVAGSNLSVSSGYKLRVVSGVTYAPEGSVAADALEILGTYNAGSATTTLRSYGTGSTCTAAINTVMPLCVNGGTFIASTSKVSFQAASATTTVPVLNYYNLDFSPSSGNPAFVTPGSSGSPSFSHTQATATGYDTSGSTATCTLANNPTPGNLVIVGFTWYNGSSASTTVVSVKDASNNSYTLTPLSPSATYGVGDGALYIAYLLSAPANASKTITITFSSPTAFSPSWCDEFTPTGGTVSFDSDAISSGSNGPTITTPIIPVTGPVDLLYSIGGPSGQVTAVNSPWVGTINNGDGAAYMTNATTSTAMNMSVNSSYDSIGASFKIVPNPSAIAVANNLTTSGSATFNAYSNNTQLSVGGNVTIGSGGNFLAPPSSSFTISGSFTNSGTFTHENGVVTMNSSASTTTVSTGNSSFYNLTLSGTGTTTSVSTTSVANILNVSSGTLNGGTSTIILSGTGTPLSVAGTFIASTSQVSFQATSGTTTVPALSYYNLDFSPSSASSTYVLGVTATSSSYGTLAIDANVTGAERTGLSNNSTFTSNSFTTTSANELILALVTASPYSSGKTTSISQVTGAGLTWHLASRYNSADGTAEIWYSYATTTKTSQTLTAKVSTSDTSSNNTGVITIVSFTGADSTGVDGAGAIGSTNACGTNNNGTPSCSLTTSRNNSWVFGSMLNWTSATAPTVPAGQTAFGKVAGGSGDYYWAQRQNSVTAASGTNVTINDTAPTNIDYSEAIVEIKPAIISVLSAFSVTNNMTMNGAGAATVDAASNGDVLTIGGSLIINGGGTFLAPTSSTFTVTDNFTNNGTFTNNGGTLTIGTTSATSIISGTSTVFNNLIIAAASSTIQFQAKSGNAPVFTFAGLLMATGSAGSLITIESTVPGTQWLAHFSNVQSGNVSYIYIKDSGCDVGSSNITVTNATNGGNNGSCWQGLPSTVVIIYSGGTSPIEGGSGGGSLVTGGGAAGGGGGVSGSWALVHHTPNDCGSTSSCVVTIPSTAAGDLLVAITTNNSGSGKISSVSGGGTWVHPAGCYDSAANGTIDCAYVLSATSGTTSVTINYTGTANRTYVDILEYSGTGPFTLDAVDSYTSSNSNPNGVALTLTGTNDVIIQGASAAVSFTNISGSYTSPKDFGNSGNAGYLGVAGLMNTSNGAAPTWTGGSGSAGLMAIAFKSGVSSGNNTGSTDGGSGGGSLVMNGNVARVQSNISTNTSGSSASTQAVTLSATTQGNTIVVAVGNAVGVSSVTDNKGNVYTLDSTGSDSCSVNIFHTVDAYGGVTTVTANLTSSDWASVVAAEYSGLTSSPFDKQASGNSGFVATGSWTTPNTPTISQANELLVGSACQYYNQSSTWTAGSNYTIVKSYGGGAVTAINLMMEDQTVSAVGTYNASGTWGWSSGERYGYAVATYKIQTPSAGGGGGGASP